MIYENLKFTRRSLVFILVLLCGTFLPAQQSQEPYLMHWSEQDGLCDNYVRCIAKDKKGFIWVGTNNGLCRFDGKSFESFRYNPKNKHSISADNIRSILDLDNGQIWIGTDGGGLNIYDYKNHQFQKLLQNSKHPEQKLAGDRVQSILERDSNTIIIGYGAIGSGKGGLTLLSKDLKIKKHVLQDVRNNSGFKLQVTETLNDSNNKDIYWLGGRNLYKWNFKTNDIQGFLHKAFSMDHTILNGLVESTDSTLLLSMGSEGLWVFDKKEGQWKTKINNNSRSIIKDKNGKIWIADDKGIGSLNVESKQIKYHLLLNGVHSPFPEKTSVNRIAIFDQNLWICTNKGLFCWNNIFQQFNINTIKRPDKENTFYSEFVGSLNTNEWVFIDRNRGLAITDSLLQLKRIIPISDPPLRKATLINHNGQQFVLMNGQSGLYKWNTKESIIKPFHPTHPSVDIDQLEVWSFYTEKNKVWIGTRFNGLLNINLDNNQVHHYSHDPNDSLSLCHNKYLFEIDKDKNGNLWIATDKGISVVDPVKEVFIKYPNLNAVENFIVHAIEQDQNGHMLIGIRDQGLFRYNMDTYELTNFTTDDGLLYNGVNQLLSIDSLTWMVTRKGMCKLNSNSDRIIGFNQKKGMPIDRLYGSRIAMLPDSSIYLAFSYSYYHSRFKSSDLQEYFAAPDLNISSLRILNSKSTKKRSINNGATIRLKPNENYFAIEFNAIHFFQARGINYEYKLEGYDKDWVEVEETNTAVYSNLPGGDYQFKIKAATTDNIWSETQQLSIFLATAWYKTPWFYLLIALLLIGIVYAIYKNRTGQIRKEEHFKRQLAETEMKALRSQINPHFIFNCLNSIKSYIIENRIEDGTEYVGRFAQLIRMVLNHSKERLIPVSREIEAIRLYVWLEQERLNNKFQVAYDWDFESDPENLKIPPLLFQPYIENAIWHGLMNLEQEGKLIITIRELKDHLSIQIIDNGIGRVQAMRNKQNSVFEKPSMGLELSERRLKQINELYQLDGKVTIEDQFPDKEHTGTVVKIIFPKIKNQTYA